MDTNSKDVQQWHALELERALVALNAPSTGLDEQEVRQRLQVYGPNLLPEKGPTPLGWIILRQFASPLIYILVAAAVVSLVIGDFKDAGFIAAVLAINMVIGAYQESQAERSTFALRKMLRTRAQVERSGEVIEVDASELVPGDIVWLESGNRVPADMRLLTSQGLEVDESLLTGESIAVTKDAHWLGAESTTLAERLNMTFAGSLVSRGRGKGVVVATALKTHIGELALDVLGSTGGKPPLLVRMEKFTKYVAVGTLAAAALIGVLGIAIGNYSLKDTFFLVIALSVAAIPEGLPVAMTVALAVATTRMASRNVIVRRLTAVEGLGSCTLIATDKTGTLTCNELTVREVALADGTTYRITGEGFVPRGEFLLGECTANPRDDAELMELLRSSVLCNEADLHHRDGDWIWRGDAVDIALLSLAQKAEMAREPMLEQYPQVNRIPFEPEHQFAASFHSQSDSTLICVKGAPERVLNMCAAQEIEARRASLETSALNMAQRGLRVLAVASGWWEKPLSPSDMAPEPAGLKLLGFVGMIDPLRAGVRDAVAACRVAGVEISMVTGDHRVTALAIARDLGLADGEHQVMTADELDTQSESELASSIERIRVFARVSPRQKLQIVNAARAAGHFVAVTGDGANDAPALRAANIGVAMGKSGTDVAREAAELVISDDNFSSIVSGIEEGRIAYDNIRKVIFLLVSTGAAELVMVLLAVVTGSPVPLLPVQLLWLNLVTNGIQGVALAFEPGEGDSLRYRPRPPDEPVFNRLMIQRVLVSILFMGGGGFAVYWFALRQGWTVAEARNLLLLTMVLFENFHVGNCRSETKSIFALSPLRSPILSFGVLAAFLLHVVAMYMPALQNLLSTGPLDLYTWGLAIAVSLSIVPAIELHKLWWKGRLRPASSLRPSV